jgi:hypothetical protein
VSVIDPGDAAEPGDEIDRQDGVEIDGAKAIHRLKKQEKEEAEMVFKVPSFAAAKPCLEPALAKRVVGEGRGAGVSPADKGNVKTGSCQGSADPDHPLVEDEIVGHGEKKTHKPANIRELRGYTHYNYPIFGLNF